MPAANDKRISQTTQIVICVLFVVGVRIYYAIVEANASALYPWFADHPWRLFGLHTLAIPAATAGAIAARRWFSPVVIIPAGVACGALVTLVYSSLTGGLIGLICGTLVLSSRLRFVAGRLVPPTCLVWIPGLLLGLLIGFVVTYTSVAADEEWKPAILISQWAVVFVVLAMATWFVLRSKSLATSGAVRALIAMGFFFLTLIGLPLGTTLDAYWRIWQLKDVTSVWTDPVPWSQVPTKGFRSVHGAVIENATDDEIKLLEGFPNIRWLTIRQCDTSGDALATLLNRLRQLEHVDVEDVAIDDEVIRALANSKRISMLQLIRTDISDGAFEYLALMPQLRALVIDGMRREGGSLKPLGRAGRIASLRIANVPLTDDDLADLKGLRALNSLTVKNAPITGTGLHHLKNLPRLTALELTDCPLDDKYLADLVPVALNWLMLGGVRLTDQGAQAIGSMNSLVGISLLRSGVTDAQLKQFDRLQSPQLVLDASQLSQESRDSLGSTDEVELRVQNATVTSDDIQRLSQLGYEVVLERCEFTKGAIDRLKKYDGSTFIEIRDSDLKEAVARQLGRRVSVW